MAHHPKGSVFFPCAPVIAVATVPLLPSEPASAVPNPINSISVVNTGATLQKVSGPCAVPGSPNATARNALNGSVGGGTEYQFLLQNLEPGCVWDIFGFDLSQKIPPERIPGNYSIQIGLTVVSS